MNTPKTVFTAVILAADRGSDDPVALAAGTRCKSMAPVGGIPMLLRVLDALAASPEIDAKILCGPAKAIIDREPRLQARIAAGEHVLGAQPNHLIGRANIGSHRTGQGGGTNVIFADTHVDWVRGAQVGWP